MFGIYAYEYIRATNDERRKRALNRYERLYRRTDEIDPRRPAADTEVVEIAFATGCPTVDRLTA